MISKDDVILMVAVRLLHYVPTPEQDVMGAQKPPLYELKQHLMARKHSVNGDSIDPCLMVSRFPFHVFLMSQLMLKLRLFLCFL